MTNLLVRAKADLTGVLNKLTNAGAVPKGQELYDCSPLAMTSELIETQRTAAQGFRSSLENVAEKLHRGFTYDNIPFEVEKEGEGTQQFISSHKDSPIKKGIVMIGRGDYNAYADIVRDVCAEGYSEEKAAMAWMRLLGMLRVDLVEKGPVKEVADEVKISPSFLGNLVSRVLVKGRLSQPDKSSVIDTTEDIVFPMESAITITQNSMYIQVIPISAGIQKIGPYNRQLSEYKIKVFDPLKIERTNSEDNPFKLAKQLDPKAMPRTELEAIAAVLAAYEKQNPEKSIFIGTSPNKKKALYLGKEVEKVTKRTEKIPVDVIVPNRPNHYDNALLIETKKSSLAGTITKYALIGAAALGIGTLCYRGIYPEKFAEFNYQIKIDGQIAEGDETYMGRDRTIDLEFLSNGERVIKHSLILPKEKKTMKKTERKNEDEKEQKKKKGLFSF